MGFDMLDQRAEFATQNLLSALSCTLLFVLLFRMCRMYLGGAASLTIAVVSMLGTSLMSTGATGLWNSESSRIFVSLALLTGVIWARPVWNTWWTFEPRLTTTLILWFIYVGYLLIG
ncbi:MAG: cytochrome c biogenesis protein CcsA, partial [Acidobacteria bacterium]|nr:cytochrome c biogenesis protein CcsA [Acidobacteriota bacterium]